VRHSHTAPPEAGPQSGLTRAWPADVRNLEAVSGSVAPVGRAWIVARAGLVGGRKEGPDSNFWHLLHCTARWTATPLLLQTDLACPDLTDAAQQRNTMPIVDLLIRVSFWSPGQDQDQAEAAQSTNSSTIFRLRA